MPSAIVAILDFETFSVSRMNRRLILIALKLVRPLKPSVEYLGFVDKGYS